MEYIVLKEIKVSGNRCEYIFEYPDEMSRYIVDNSQTLFIELPVHYNLQDVPEALLAVPFVGSVMCVTMLLGYGIKVPKLDKTFYESIPNIRNVFMQMYPYCDFCFDVKTSELVDCKMENACNKSVFFTGGLDATSALVEHISEKPLMINIWGGDILLDDVEYHIALENYLKKLSSQIGNEYIFMKSNCRWFFDDARLSTYLYNVLRPEHNHGWWASIAHILSMTSVIAPIVYFKEISVHYIGAGYGTDANNQGMSKAIRYASCLFHLVDDGLCRHQKINKIVKYSAANNINFELKVCWYRNATKNCSNCEKCYRTILDILCNHSNPNDYGFDFKRDDYKKIKKFLKYNLVNETIWIDGIQKKFKSEPDYWAKKKEISWILNFDFNNPRRLALYGIYRKIRGLLGRVKRKIVG